MADCHISKDGPFRILGNALTYLLSDFFSITFLHFFMIDMLTYDQIRIRIRTDLFYEICTRQMRTSSHPYLKCTLLYSFCHMACKTLVQQR